MMNTAPTLLTAMQYARVNQYETELAAIARRELHNPDHPDPDETLARWAADTLVPDAMFYTVDEHRVLAVLRGAYKAAGTCHIQRSDGAEARYELAMFDVETQAKREQRRKRRLELRDGEKGGTCGQ